MKNQSIFVIFLSALAPMLIVSCANVAPQELPGKTNSAAVKPYPLDTCMVIGAKLSSTSKTYTRIHDGQEVKFCCKSCVIAFEANPEPFMAKLR